MRDDMSDGQFMELPSEVVEAAMLLENHFRKRGIKKWRLMGVASVNFGNEPVDVEKPLTSEET